MQYSQHQKHELHIFSVTVTVYKANQLYSSSTCYLHQNDAFYGIKHRYIFRARWRQRKRGLGCPDSGSPRPSLAVPRGWWPLVLDSQVIRFSIQRKRKTYLSFKGGTTENATYRNIGDHTEAVEVKESIVSTETDQCSVGVWSVRDRFQKPTGHFLVGPWFNGACVFEACFFYVNHIFHVYCSTFRQYMSAIFCHGDEQMRLAQESLKAAQIDLKKEIQTVIQPAGPFYQAEEWVLQRCKKRQIYLFGSFLGYFG